MTDRGSVVFNLVNLVISLAALGVSIYSADQARRAVATSERMVPIVEEQVRPRLLFEKRVALLDADSVELTLTVKNEGSAGAEINRLQVRLPSPWSTVSHEFTGIARGILHIGRSRTTRLRLPRRFRPPGADAEVDLGRLDPGKFAFTLAYAVYGKPQITFEESIQFSAIEWDERTSKPPSKATTR